MVLVRPRLTDCYGLLISQENVDFVIPILDEDLPFYVDPFLLWKSPSQQDNSLHRLIIDVVNTLGKLHINGDKSAIQLMIEFSECEEAGLGYSGSRKGQRISEDKAVEILDLYKRIPQINQYGLAHFEIIQLYIDKISKDRISDISCNIIKSFLIDYSIEQAKKIGLPLEDVELPSIFDSRSFKLIPEKVKLPINPETKSPTLLIPKRWLRKNPWINNDDYFFDYLSKKTQTAIEHHLEKGEILQFNRNNFDIVSAYIKEKERTQSDCKNDPLFIPIPIYSARRKFKELKSIPTGKDNNADKRYEELISQLAASLFYPHLDFASFQSRVDTGKQIRDAIFYNNRSISFFEDIYQLYNARQIVFELKNVKEIEREHINQLNRYLKDEFGNFGVFFTRNELTKAMFQNTIDLWSGQRKCIITISDIDLEMMVDVFESKQRYPYEIIKKKYIEFSRKCPG